jgi:hypothetical protein
MNTANSHLKRNTLYIRTYVLITKKQRIQKLCYFSTAIFSLQANPILSAYPPSPSNMWTSEPIFMEPGMHEGARGSVVGWGTMPKAGRSRVRVPMTWIFFNWPNPSSRIVFLGSTQPLTEMSTRNVPGGKGRRARKAGNFTAICEPTV